MASTGLFGPFSLTDEQINAHVGTAIGAYALGPVDTSDGKFIVSYVGRSDHNLNKRLHDWIGSYSQFKYGHFKTKKAAFEKECRMYHDFGGKNRLDNKAHPDRPAGTSYPCPVPGCTELD
ncbi:MAG: hypothetical protein IMF16_05030 [Proteobacteria bacterium]|nr:hypothetical protein [Pseudomonadota bacterium]